MSGLPTPPSDYAHDAYYRGVARAPPPLFAPTGANVNISNVNTATGGEAMGYPRQPASAEDQSVSASSSSSSPGKLRLIWAAGLRYPSKAAAALGSFQGCPNPLRMRIPVLHLSIPVLVALAGAAVHAVLLLAAICNIGFASNTALWPFLYGWILGGYVLVLGVVCMILAQWPGRSASNMPVLRYYDARRDLTVVTAYGISHTLLGVFSALWVGIRVPGQLPLDPALQFQEYVTQQLLFVLYIAAHLVFISSATFRHVNRYTKAILYMGQ
jgi:hypothetical protein